MMQQLTAEELNQLYDPAAWPVFESVEYDFNQNNVFSAQFIIKIDESLEYFAGHFPDQAVLPGVVQVHWAGELARKCLACDGFHSLKRVKFNNVVLPSTRVCLSLTYKSKTGNLTFDYRDQQEKYSSGVINFLEQA